MVNHPLQSPANPHFFQPLLPGSETHLSIPVTFFSKHIEGKNEQKTARLISDASDRIWQVKMDGRRLTQGWKEFATAHNLQIGDIIIFKHQGDMLFSVTPFGPSCCEIQYVQCLIKKEDDNVHDDEDDMENQQNTRKGLRKENNLKPKTETELSLSYDYCFVANVTASNLKFDTMNLPKKASSSKALNKRCHKIILVNKEGNSWTLNLRFRESEGSYYIRGGWKRFCSENRQKEGDLITFNLVGDGRSTPMLCICPEEACSELMGIARGKKKTKKRRMWVASSSSRQNSFVTLSLTAYNIKYSKINLPVEFTKINGITRKHEKIILMDKHGVKRLTRLVHDGPNYGRRGLGKGWKLFCEANGVLRIGEPFKLKLTWENNTPLLRFCSKVKEGPIYV
ncbi:DNA-binding pseudobarrel domain superfamily [Arabidopsis suecica]|uniref:DNA-binding pseudobarrel domain superfamily n=1 Tax=Arabidopsis suecica TaxID=45249 RepID=A0A8T1YH93_ARASU|nr:DNA-binding pseudobarrel domain superfamily [Arabidopsis suecica]